MTHSARESRTASAAELKPTLEDADDIPNLTSSERKIKHMSHNTRQQLPRCHDAEERTLSRRTIRLVRNISTGRRSECSMGRTGQSGQHPISCTKSTICSDGETVQEPGSRLATKVLSNTTRRASIQPNCTKKGPHLPEFNLGFKEKSGQAGNLPACPLQRLKKAMPPKSPQQRL